MEEKNISIKDIARLCNVSVPTVSRIINHTGRYSVDTERKVMKLLGCILEKTLKNEDITTDLRELFRLERLLVRRGIDYPRDPEYVI